MSALRRDRIAQRYHKNLEGLNAQGFFSPTVPSTYSVVPTVAELALATPAGIAGEIGMYDANGDLLTIALVPGQVFQFFQKNSNGQLKRSTAIKVGTEVVRKEIYSARQKQVTHVGFNGVSGDLNLNIVGGLQEFVLIAKDNSSANQPFPTMEGRAIVRGGSPTAYDIANEIASTMVGSFDYEENGDLDFIAVNVVTANIVGTAGAAGVYTFVDKSNQVIVNADVTLEAIPGTYLQNMEVLAGFPPQIFKVVSAAFDGTKTLIELDRPFSGANLGVETTGFADILYALEADVVAAALGISIVSKYHGSHFDVVVAEDLGDADVTRKADWAQGNGAAAQVASMEDETIVFDGFTTGNEAWPGDFGMPDLWVDENSADKYTLYFIDVIDQVIPSAGTPQNQTLHKKHLIIGAIEGSDLETQLNIIFNLP